MDGLRKHAKFGDEIDWNFHIGQVLEGGSIFHQLTPEWEAITNNMKDNISTSYEGKLSILDCGCHLGRWMELFQKAGFEYTGVDQSEQVVEEAKKIHPKDNFVAKFLWDLEYNEQFDSAMCIAVLQHNQLYEKRKIIPSIFKALKFGGVFLVLESTMPAETATQLTHDGWIKIMADFGFEFIKSWHKNEFELEDNYLFRKPLLIKR